MRLKRVFIGGYKNLEDLEVTFDPSHLTTVIIGQNGTGKSNLIEAVASVFRYVDMQGDKERSVDRETVNFRYEIDYQIGNRSVRLSNMGGRPAIFVDGNPVANPSFERNKIELFPDLIFGYYSGTSRRLETQFEAHQRRYYNVINFNDSSDDYSHARGQRRLFYCRPIHGDFALLAAFAHPEPQLTRLLNDTIGDLEFDSALAIFREPSFGKLGPAAKRGDARELWGTRGPAGACARAIRDASYYPLAYNEPTVDDYRTKQETEACLGCFIRSKDALDQVAANYADDREMFAALEASDIVGLLRDIHLWVTRKNLSRNDIVINDLSEGERQLLMVLGLIRVSRGKRVLFLLDEPDTHLNPVWQYSYLDLIERWIALTTDANDCQFILSTHNPVVVGGLRKEQVRILGPQQGKQGHVIATVPECDPMGIGIEGLLKSELYGLRSSLAPEVLRKLDQHYALLGRKNRTEAEQAELIRLTIELNDLSVSRTHPNPYFEGFAHAMARRRNPHSALALSKAEIEDQAKVADDIIAELIAEDESRAKGAAT